MYVINLGDRPLWKTPPGTAAESSQAVVTSRTPCRKLFTSAESGRVARRAGEAWGGWCLVGSV